MLGEAHGVRGSSPEEGPSNNQSTNLLSAQMTPSRPPYDAAATHEDGVGLSGGSGMGESAPLRRSDSAGSVRGGVSGALRGDGGSVRVTVARSVAAQAATPALDASRRRGREYAPLVVQTVLKLPSAIAAAVVLPQSVRAGEYCAEVPLMLWAILFAILLASTLGCAWVLHFEPDREEHMSWVGRTAEQTQRTLEAALGAFAIIGQWWVQAAGETCAQSSPTLLVLSFWMVVLGITYVLLPCIIILLMLPFMCFCLPCVIRLLARVAGADPLRGKGATADLIALLPLKSFSPDLFPDEADPQCAICLSSYERGEEVRILPCDARHHFHKGCCDEWLTVNATCPICRARVVGQEEVVQQDYEGADVEQGRARVAPE
jgi:hypothetical protein